MNGHRVLGMTFLAAIAVRTIGEIDPIGGGPSLPSPKKLAAVFAAWFVLGLVAAAGPAPARAAGTFSLLMLLSMLVIGPFGKKAITFLEGVSHL